MKDSWYMRGKVLALAMVGLLLFGCTSSTPSSSNSSPSDSPKSSGSATPAKDASATPAPPPANYVGKMTLSPNRGPAGTTVTVTGTGLPASTQLDVVWNSVKGSWVLKGSAQEEYHGRKFDPVTVVLTRVTTDASGNFETKVQVPDDTGFSHDITVVKDGVIRNKAAFSEDMQVAISAESGPVGTPITLTAKGIGFRSLENSWMVMYDNNFTGFMSAVTTQGRAKVVIPAAGSPGKHTIQVVHGSFTVPYLNGQQSPSPDRPIWTFIFNVTDGPAVMPPAADKQSLPSEPAVAVSGNGPALQVSPSTGPVGTPLTITGTGLPAGKEAHLNWSTVAGNRVSGSGWEEQTKEIAKATVGPTGTVKFTLNAPDDLGAVHRISVKTEDQTVGSKFTITPSAFPMSVTSGPVGTKFEIHLKGVGWTETANIYNLTYDNSYLGYVCGFNSQGDVVIPMIASGAPGWHYIDLYPGIYKGEEIGGVQDFRIPQLTFAEDHPGEKLPAFHFAFQVTP